MAGQTKHHPEIWINRRIHTVIAKVCLPAAEAVGAINWRDYLNSNFDELLEAEYSLA